MFSIFLKWLENIFLKWSEQINFHTTTVRVSDCNLGFTFIININSISQYNNNANHKPQSMEQAGHGS